MVIKGDVISGNIYLGDKVSKRNNVIEDKSDFFSDDDFFAGDVIKGDKISGDVIKGDKIVINLPD